ncbi:VCBS repeat-containing protein [Shimia thalassica]|uniref:FG-GAP repeat domain-containing protein n=1 Tax=Shimia thalassica TaxID=1715693 RepID=UPI00209002D9|nr:VCBS repeat-containing protein [Shimia thalassica]MDO6502548.1 VCBS repeat-containing protein [Shimia thalassica]
MLAMARRHGLFLLPRHVRRAALASLFVLAGGVSAFADIVSARYVEQTSVYAHGAVPEGEYAGIEFRLSGGRVLTSSAGEAVYEDTAPRLVDVNGDGTPEVLSVISYFDRGAALRIWGEVADATTASGTSMAVLAETPAIGRRHRWLAVVGAADLDGDGHVEIAYIDRPHLAKTLRVWRYNDGTLTQVAEQGGLTNHRIGETHISGGIRDCGDGPEMITATSDWTRIIATRFADGTLTTRDIGRFTGRRSMSEAMACRG